MSPSSVVTLGAVCLLLAVDGLVPLAGEEKRILVPLLVHKTLHRILDPDEHILVDTDSVTTLL
jgi:hypothetical protein